MKRIINKVKSIYDNLMNGTKLGYYLRKTVSTKNAYLLFIIFGSLVLLGTYVSYALFTVAQEKDKAFKIIVGNLVSNISSDELDDTNSIIVEANSSRIATITLSNTNSIKAKYNLNYVVYDMDKNIVNDAVNVKYVEVSKDKPNKDGQYTIDKASSQESTKEIRVILTNTADAAKKVTFDSQVGLATAPLNNKENVNVVNQEFKYTYDAYADSINTTNIPYEAEDTEIQEFKLAYKSTDEESLYIKVNKNTVYMDVSETLDSQNVTVAFKSNFSNGETYIEHPQTANSLSESNIFGQSNLTNIQNYFSFANVNKNITKIGSFTYDDIEAFLLNGNITNQTQTLNGQDITFGFYGHYKENEDTYNFYDETKFSILDENNHYIMPGFKLYTYDKTKFKTEIEKIKKKMYDYDPFEYEIDAYIQKINNAINNYYNKRKVTQKELDEILEDLKDGPKKYNYFDYKYFYDNKSRGPDNSTNDILVYKLKPNTKYEASSNIPYTEDGKARFYIVSGGSYSVPYTNTDGFGKDNSRIVTTDDNGNLFIATQNSYSPIVSGPIDIENFENGTYWIKLKEVE